MSKIRLMVPGPVEVDPAILLTMACEEISHYSEEAISLYNFCVSSLRKLFHLNMDGDVFIMPGSGSIAMDTCIGSMVRRNDTVIIGVNGTFSERTRSQALAYGANVQEVRVPEGKAVTAELIDEALIRHREAKAVILTHLETSTGVISPVKNIGEVTNNHNVPFIVDAVSSFGIDEFLLDEWNVSICGSASQKGLESPPGLGIVAVTARGWREIEKKGPSCNGWFSDVQVWKRTLTGKEIRKGVVYPLPMTMPVNNIRALEASLNSIKTEGAEARMKRHSVIAHSVRKGLTALGFELFPPDGCYSSGVTVVRNNQNIQVDELIRFIKYQYRTEISNGLFDLYNRIIRIGHIGATAYPDAVIPVLFGIEQYLRKKGRFIPIGASLGEFDNLLFKEGIEV